MPALTQQQHTITHPSLAADVQALSASFALLRVAQRQTSWWIARSCADASWSGFETAKVSMRLSEKNEPRLLPILAQRDHMPRLLLLFFRCDKAFKTRQSRIMQPAAGLETSRSYSFYVARLLCRVFIKPFFIRTSASTSRVHPSLAIKV